MAKKTQSNEDTDVQNPDFVRKQRVFRGEQELFHDLFKLNPAKLKQNHGFSDEDPLIVELEHSHLFHSVDSGGRPQTTCIPIGGHFHFVKMIANKDGVPELEISTPKKWVMKKAKGSKSMERVAVDVVLGDVQDTHTHTYEYRGSEKITLRKPNIEAMKLESAMHAIHNPSVPGVLER